MDKPVLYGFSYEGRKPSSMLHQQILNLVKIIQDEKFINGRTWGAELQDDIGKKMGFTAGGQVRTIKRMMEQLNIITSNVLSRGKVPNYDTLLTEDGKMFIVQAELEEQVESLPIDYKGREALLKELEAMYRAFYSGVVYNYHYPEGPRNDGKPLHMLRAVLKALQKYKTLDYWEWYLFTTFIIEDDNEQQEKALEEYILAYRSKQLNFNTAKDKPQKYELSHSYHMGYLELSGFVKVKGSGYSMLVEEAKYNSELKKEVLSELFLKDYYSNHKV